jgi:hypothetical protein
MHTFPKKCCAFVSFTTKEAVGKAMECLQVNPDLSGKRMEYFPISYAVVIEKDRSRTVALRKIILT